MLNAGLGGAKFCGTGIRKVVSRWYAELGGIVALLRNLLVITRLRW